MKKYIARWFQDVNGRYLSIDESDKSITLIKAVDKETAILSASEKEQEDSEIPFNDRVLVTEIK